MPRKVNIFMWRTRKNLFSTRLQVALHGVLIQSLSCLLCDFHALLFGIMPCCPVWLHGCYRRHITRWLWKERNGAGCPFSLTFKHYSIYGSLTEARNCKVIRCYSLFQAKVVMANEVVASSVCLLWFLCFAVEILSDLFHLSWVDLYIKKQWIGVQKTKIVIAFSL